MCTLWNNEGDSIVIAKLKKPIPDRGVQTSTYMTEFLLYYSPSHVLVLFADLGMRLMSGYEANMGLGSAYETVNIARVNTLR